MGWGVSCRGGVGWVMQGWGGVCHVGVEIGRVGCVIQGGVGHVGVGWAVNNLICHKLGVLSFLLTNYCQLLSG